MMSIFAKFTKRGHEIPDPTPVTVPINLRKSESMDERIARIVQHSVSKAAQEQGMESFEDADDFDIPDDPVDPSSPWEHDFDMATANAIDKGVVQKPDLSTDRYNELKGRYFGRKKDTPPKNAEDEPPLPLEE